MKWVDEEVDFVFNVLSLRSIDRLCGCKDGILQVFYITSWPLCVINDAGLLADQPDSLSNKVASKGHEWSPRCSIVFAYATNHSAFHAIMYVPMALDSGHSALERPFVMKGCCTRY